MWFEDENLTGRRRTRGSRKRARPTTRLGVGLTGGPARRRDGARPLLPWILLPAMALAVIGLVGFLLHQSYQALFPRNPMFTLRQIDIRTDDSAFISRALVQEWIQEHETQRLTEGMNLFAVHIGALRQDLLQKTPNFKTVDIERILPDTLRMTVRERTPIAFLRQRRGDDLFLDEDAVAFVERRSLRTGMPHIVEYDGAALRPGQQGDGLLRDAVKAIAEFRRVFASENERLVRISARGHFEGLADSLRLTLSNGTVVDLWWKRTVRDEGPAPDLEERLKHLAKMLRHADENGMRLRSVNLTLDDFAANAPFTSR